MKTKLMFLLTIAFAINSYSFAQKTEIYLNQVKPDARLYECFDKAYIQQLQKDNPETILYYNFYLDNSYFVGKQVPGKPVQGKNINEITLKNEISSGKVQYFNENVSDFNPKTFNVLKYNFNTDYDKYTNYILGNTGKILIFYPEKKFTKKYNDYKKFLSYKNNSDINAGYDRESSVPADLAGSYKSIKSTSEGFDSTMFLPDGPDCGPCYNTDVEFSGFAPGQTITGVNDILSICVNMEHSFVGDLEFRIICPNGQSAVLKEYIQSGNGYLGVPYGGDSHGSYDNGCDPADNPSGTGWNYCWSEMFSTIGTINDHSSEYTLDSTNTGSYTGYYDPDASFSGLIGCPLNGVWTIEICDYWAIDNGYVFSWDLNVIYNSNLPNLITGKVYNDTDGDCVFNGGDFPMQNVMIEVQPGPYYGITDANGNYSAWVDSGTYTLNQILPNTLWQQLCPDTTNNYTITVTQAFGDTISDIDFANEADFYCPVLSVDISTWSLRACMYNYYSVQYCNNGTAPADNTTIEIELDSNMTYLDGGNLISQNGNMLVFDIGTVNPGVCGSFQFNIWLACDSSLIGTTICVKAHIYPDTLCFPADSTWDKSSVAVEGECVSDSLACFTIYNTGDPVEGDMDGTSEYRIYENNILVYTGIFQIAGGDSLIICWTANGNTIRLEADQRPGHPGNSHPQDNVEMCGDSLETFVTGQITVVPEDDQDDFVEIACNVVSSSWDPNDKQVKPEGLTETFHYIDSADLMEYIIHFQNTGTDTAFNVVINDALSSYLDITTIQPGASSHPYTLNILGSNVLQWTFANILLPDSNINELESHGFVKYKIHQKHGNTIGTVINNKANIIFDFNAPVITNTVFNTIGNIDSVTSNIPIIYDNKISVKVYPNPFNSTTVFEINGMNQPFKFELYNITGEQVRSISNITGKKFVISRQNLRKGIYIYKISSDNGLISTGKLIVN